MNNRVLPVALSAPLLLPLPGVIHSANACITVSVRHSAGRMHHYEAKVFFHYDHSYRKISAPISMQYYLVAKRL